MTDSQFKKLCKDTVSDCKASGIDIDGCAFDIADNMLYDPKVIAYVKKKLGSSYNKTTAREFVGDCLY